MSLAVNLIIYIPIWRDLYDCTTTLFKKRYLALHSNMERFIQRIYRHYMHKTFETMLLAL